MDIYLKCEEEFTNPFSSKEIINNYIIRYYDDILFDMYDHNFFYVTNKITNDDLDYLIKYQKENNYDFIKIVSNINLELDNSFEKDTILILVKDNSFDIKENKLLSFSNLKDNPKYAKDILNNEKRYYGKRLYLLK